MFFFFNDTATTEIYTLSLHDALPIYSGPGGAPEPLCREGILGRVSAPRTGRAKRDHRSEEHTSELQSQSNLVCRLLLEKKNKDWTSKDASTYTPRVYLSLVRLHSLID